MDSWDIILTPMYFCIILSFAFAFARRNRKDELIRKYYLMGLTLKLLCSVAFGLVYQFYYKGGDTFTFWNEVKIMNEKILPDDPFSYVKLFFTPLKSANLSDFSSYVYELQISYDKSSFFVIKAASIISLFTFTTYSSTALIFALIAFLASWNLFRTLQKQYPQLTNKLAFACLFIPSVAFWGSSIMKDTICLAALCYIYTNFYELISERKNTIKNILLIVISGYILFTVKIYILICIIPGLTIWLFIRYNNMIKSKSTRNVLRPIVIILACTLGIGGVSIIGANDERYSLQNLQSTSNTTATYLKQISIESGGSVYDLGETDFSLVGLITLIPKGINVTLFRPYLWESRNIVMVLSALESTYFIWITLSVLFKNGSRIFQKINNDTFVYFSIIFSLTFSFAVGISTNNFGSLVRYKLPMMPFYLSAMMILNHSSKSNKIQNYKSAL